MKIIFRRAEAYYREFCELSGDDPRQYLLRFLILEAKDAPLEQQINSLERYCQEELDEKWLYHLAELYHQANQADDCVRICDKIMLMFGLGKYVDKAMELKLQYAPLTKYQMDLVENREKYEEKLRAVEEEYKNGTYRKPEPEGEYLDSEEIYQALTAYIIDYLSTDTGFPSSFTNTCCRKIQFPDRKSAWCFMSRESLTKMMMIMRIWLPEQWELMIS